MEQNINGFDEIYIEREYEHIYGFKHGRPVEILEPHSRDFERVKELIEKSYKGMINY